MHELVEFAQAFWEELVSLIPYFIAGVGIEALIRTYKWHNKIRRTITRYGALSIVIAVGLGLFSPLCACGVLPLSLGMFFSGMPFSIMMALIISSPLLSPAGFTLTQWELGNQWALAKTVAAAFMGLYAGFLTRWLEQRFFRHDEIIKSMDFPHDPDFHDPDFPIENLRCNCHLQMSHQIERKYDSKFILFLAKFWEGFVRIGKYLLIGVFFEILVMRYAPSDIIGTYFSEGNVWNILSVALISIPMYVNQITATAVLYGLVEQKMAIGPAMAFLIGGPVSAIPVMMVFWTVFKRRAFFYYLFICVSGTLMVSLFFQSVWEPMGRLMTAMGIPVGG